MTILLLKQYNAFTCPSVHNNGTSQALQGYVVINPAFSCMNRNIFLKYCDIILRLYYPPLTHMSAYFDKMHPNT